MSAKAKDNHAITAGSSEELCQFYVEDRALPLLWYIAVPTLGETLVTRCTQSKVTQYRMLHV
ncbi:MAG TPA: hypothetical protein VFU48_12735 [Nitrospira sp.]|nr:hypothetical protein [Nitrospira sp.]